VRLAPRCAMLGGVLAWLWPIGSGGQMPVGGDATQFSMGLMAFLRSSIRSGRIPLWNDLWGFGFPGLAESQMGAFYPPHLLLYGLLSTEVAYTTSLVLHVLWGAAGAAWLARRMGTSEAGSAIAGFAWATSGFALIHLPHQWSYTVGSWMPWAWGLAWRVARGEGDGRTPGLLAGVLALQILPGHFQLAFITEVGVVLLALAGGGWSVRRRVLVGLAMASAVPMAAMQLVPTAELASLAGSRRDFEYLSGFAASPVHLVSYVAPGLFHRSPLWRPVAWDPFHTSPEEHLAYVGLVPLYLAIRAIRRGWRDDAGVRAMAIVAGVTVVLGLGPYAPGFESLIRLPGFSFFRAPARWGLGSALALAVLAGKGFDGLRSRPGPGRSAALFALTAAAAVAAVVAGLELAMASVRGPGWPPAASAFDRAMRSLPWAGMPGDRPFRAVIAEAYRPQGDIRVRSALARVEGRAPTSPGPTLAAERAAIYRRELGETAALLAAILAASVLTGRPRAFATALVTIAAADALLMARHRPFDLGPARSLVDQSPVLARIAAGPRGVRTLDPAQNLFLIAGGSPVSAYRTLDLPAPAPLFRIAEGPATDPRAVEAVRVAGVGARVLDPSEPRSPDRPGPDGRGRDGETIRDPALAGWLYGVDLASTSIDPVFRILRPASDPSQAWLVGSPIGGLEVDGMADPSALLGALRGASPLTTRSAVPERAELDVEVRGTGPSTVVLSRTFDPGWRASWSGPSGDRPGAVVRVLGGWQGVAALGPGRWTLRLDYPGRSTRLGLEISALAWAAWVVLYLRPVGAGRLLVDPGGEP